MLERNIRANGVGCACLMHPVIYDQMKGDYRFSVACIEPGTFILIKLDWVGKSHMFKALASDCSS